MKLNAPRFRHAGPARVAKACGLWPALTILVLISLPAANSLAQGGRANINASATFDSDGVLWAVDATPEHVRVRRSKDFGGNWSEAVVVNPEPEPVSATGDSRPKIAVGGDGELYVTWTRPLERPFTGEIRFSRSLDQGRSWSPPITVHADRQQITHRFDAIEVTKDGRIFIAWIDKRDLELAKAADQPYRGAAVYFAVSDDRGASFRGDYRLTEHSCECCRIATQADGDGVLAFWRHIFEPNIRDHALARMNPDGSSGPTHRATFDQWAVDACPHHGPSLAIDDRDQLHAVWFTLGPENSGVFYGRLERGGAPIARRRIGGERAEHADIAVAGSEIALVWREFNGAGMQLWGSRSSDRGQTWSDTLLATTTNQSAQPQLLVRNGRFHAYWHTLEEPHRVLTLP
ncbi:MAG: glycoside hydrolase [Xanthomonadaceae bacterium]|nr:glycoside hydrolase [Xanthomonadaceae bacterium]